MIEVIHVAKVLVLIPSRKDLECLHISVCMELKMHLQLCDAHVDKARSAW